jgi:hypothetical protein
MRSDQKQYKSMAAPPRPPAFLPPRTPRSTQPCTSHTSPLFAHQGTCDCDIVAAASGLLHLHLREPRHWRLQNPAWQNAERRHPRPCLPHAVHGRTRSGLEDRSARRLEGVPGATGTAAGARSGSCVLGFRSGA